MSKIYIKHKKYTPKITNLYGNFNATEVKKKEQPI